MKKTKIIATLGPASIIAETIRDLIQSGLNVARLNMSHHYNPEELKTIVKAVRDEAEISGKSVSILFDLSGPKIRVKQFTHISEISIIEGETYELGMGDCQIPLNLPLQFDKVSGSGKIKIDDGRISFKVVENRNESLVLKALNSGEILPGKGINFPGVELGIPTFTEKDSNDLQLAVNLDADWIAMSFVRSAEDVLYVRKKLEDQNKSIPIIAKIEKPEAIENLNEIVNSFDGVLVARGDLGVEMPLRELPILQKKIVNQCLKQKKPVIIATQMLESMIKQPNPTRAEVNDVANAIYDCADAVMLSGETAVGKYPVETVAMMSDIIQSVELDFAVENFNRLIEKHKIKSKNARESICHAAMTISDDLNIDIIVIMTETGRTARTMAQYRPKAKIFALCPIQKICSQLALIWGITPILVDQYNTTDEMILASNNILSEKGYVKKGEQFIITAGVPVGVSGSTNMVKIHKVM